MHLVRIDAVSLDEGEAAVDLGQEPGDCVVLSFTDSDLAGIARAHAAEPDLPSLRLAKLAKLRHPLSVDLYIERIVARAKVVVIRCLGGLDYWRYGIERCAEAARAHGVVLAVLPGDDRPDPRLSAFSTDPALADQLDGYFRAGGPENLRRMLRLLAARTGTDLPVEPPLPLPRGFAWCPGCITPPLEQAFAAARTAVPLGETEVEPLALLLVYRSAVLGGETAPFVALIAALRARGIGVLPMAVSSLKEPGAAAAVAEAVRARRPDLVIAATAFSAREDGTDFVLDGADCPVLQAFTVGSPQAAWEASARGLGAADLAMQVALPEFDGRLSGFRSPSRRRRPRSRASPSAGPCPTRRASRRLPTGPPAGYGWPPCPGPSGASRWSCPIILPGAAAPASRSASTRRRAPGRSPRTSPPPVMRDATCPRPTR